MRFNFAKIFQLMCNMSPNMKRLLWRIFYQYFNKLIKAVDGDIELTFMNYGFAHLDSNRKKLFLEDIDEKHRFCVQLYHHIVSATNLRKKDVLEVGCGRGGGSCYIMKNHKPRSMTGVDFSEKAIDFCERYYSIEGLSFLRGDAESLPFEENKFDVVVNVESSRCYGSIKLFLREVARVLRPNGYFLFADFRNKNDLLDLRKKIKNSRLKLLKEELITDNVIKAMEMDHKRKSGIIQQKAPKFLHKSLEDFTGTIGSKIYQSFVSGENKYFNFVLQKKKQMDFFFVSPHTFSPS